MAVFAMASFYAMKYALGHSSRIMTIVSLIVAVIVYLLSVVKLNVLSKEDYNLLPGGEKIYKILSKIKLVK